ncbi:MAG TPA: hemerythrin domain-containing protein [Bacteroidales bacterium]|nr:hemerythrin domain-containing protein [Bacteroidales bacterium]
MKATQQLKDEHEGIKLMLRIMEKISIDLTVGKELNCDHYEKIIEFLQGFADRCHHAKEEEILFPALEKHGIQNEGGPIGIMINEHRKARELIIVLNMAFKEFKEGNKQAIQCLISSSRDYVQLLKNHIEKENFVLFMLADKVLSEEEQSKIAEAFEKLEIEKIGIGKHDAYHHLLKELKNVYL